MIPEYEMLNVDVNTEDDVEELLNQCPKQHAILIVVTDDILHKFVISLN